MTQGGGGRGHYYPVEMRWAQLITQEQLVLQDSQEESVRCSREGHHQLCINLILRRRGGLQCRLLCGTPTVSFCHSGDSYRKIGAVFTLFAPLHCVAASSVSDSSSGSCTWNRCTAGTSHKVHAFQAVAALGLRCQHRHVPHCHYPFAQIGPSLGLF